MNLTPLNLNGIFHETLKFTQNKCPVIAEIILKKSKREGTCPLIYQNIF